MNIDKQKKIAIKYQIQWHFITILTIKVKKYMAVDIDTNQATKKIFAKENTWNSCQLRLN